MTEEIIPNILLTRYSNAVNIQASNNDVALDFMALPPMQRDGKLFLDGVRIYLTHEQARLLADLINTTLEKVNGELKPLEERGKRE